MPALTGQVILTLPGQVQATYFFDPSLGTLRDNTSLWTDITGVLWTVASAAFIGINQLDHAVKAVVFNTDGTVARQIVMNPGATAVSALQLTLSVPPAGPWLTRTDFNGLTFDLS